MNWIFFLRKKQKSPYKTYIRHRRLEPLQIWTLEEWRDFGWDVQKGNFRRGWWKVKRDKVSKLFPILRTLETKFCSVWDWRKIFGKYISVHFFEFSSSLTLNLITHSLYPLRYIGMWNGVEIWWKRDWEPLIVLPKKIKRNLSRERESGLLDLLEGGNF